MKKDQVTNEKQQSQGKQPLDVAATSCFMADGGDYDAYREYSKSTQPVMWAVKALWLKGHPERHALMLLFDEDGRMSVFDSLAPNEYYNIERKVERHRLMMAALLAHAEPGLAIRLLYWMRTLVGHSTLRLKDLEAAIEATGDYPKWLPEVLRGAHDLLRHKVELKKVASYGKD